ncbi:MAG: flagellar basal body-associated protein FliL [Gammaproteobacteria bacterium]|nr:flagellar basal body-associated protein FliL [Gammaproteobacteria bacterium]
MKAIFSLLIASMMLFSANSYAAEDEEVAADEYAYFAFEPDITTNYLTSGKKVGFIRLTMEVMVKNPDDLAIVEHHAPLLRAAIVEVLGQQTEDKVKSASGKQEIRELCLETLNDLLKQETGKKLIVRLLFTKYIHH